jgi:sensor histidine kinase regulating citrate/malate metabolism
MADAILNSKISLAKSKGIAVKVDAHIPVKLKTSELDLCVIIGNLFETPLKQVFHCRRTSE